MKSPLVTIITVVYNGEKYLSQTIDSVVNQTYSNIEYIIIDGGSTDDTLNIIAEYKDVISKVVSEPDKGLYDAMNKGIGFANGELIGMINSDDWYELNAVELMVNAYNLNPKKTIFHADRYNVDNDGNRVIRKFHPSAFKFKYYGMTYNHPSMFITKNEYDLHLYNNQLKSHSDYQFLLEAFLNDRQKIFYIPITIVNYRLDGVSANMPFWESIIAVYTLRRNVGFSILEAFAAFLFTRGISVVKLLKRKV